jgi:hypothetical protein
VILASASIPGVFPPVLIEVEADGRRYDELHVDGGVTAQLFFSPGGADWNASPSGSMPAASRGSTSSATPSSARAGRP